MTFRLLGMSDEERLAFEEATGVKSEAGKIILDRSAEMTEQAGDYALREIQSIIGPHGSVSRWQAGGIRITPGGGISVFNDGVTKTNIQPNGTLVIGSDITLPAT